MNAINALVTVCARNPHGPNIQHSVSECAAGTFRAKLSR